MKKIVLYLSFLCFVLWSFSSFSQERKTLERKHKKLKNEIKQINHLLFETKKEKGDALDDLKDLTQKIDTRAQLIKVIELESQKISKEINNNQKQLNSYNKQLKSLKEAYTNMVVKTYKSRSLQSKTMFLLSSESFYQAYKRLKYMQQYNEYRKNQGLAIIVKLNEIKKINNALIQKKKKKEVLISDEKSQKSAIETDKKTQETLVTKIKGAEKKYKQNLRSKIKEEKQITARIDKLILREIAKANRKKRAIAKAKALAKAKRRKKARLKAITDARKRANKLADKKEREIALQKARELAETTKKEITAANKKAKEKELASKNEKKKTANSFVLDADEKKLLHNFEQNKGNLPWPVKGIITRKYGVQPHPTFSGININSPGLHIVTKINTDAKSIFNGKVLAIQSQSGGKKSVLIQHANYISAYNNLEKVYVAKGTLIKTGDKIGRVFTNKISGKTKLLFVLFKDTAKLNPAKWIRKK
ncbi:peptidoglycan DD-metalloendopeptidase family protein [Tenacibaculum finnmarkense]|nr:peptidoglycan DD-metalloendopeptidase family protein [Tenacibaculum finnmarkense]